MEGAPLQRADIAGAVAALGRAFEADAVYRSLWPDDAQRRRALPRFMAVPVRDAYAHGHVTVIRDGAAVLGVAAWLPPGAFPFSARRKAAAVPRMASVGIAAPRSFPRLARFGTNIEHAFPDDRPAYLAVVGVVPEAQGQGVGSALLAPGLEICDATGSDAYLETAGERAVRLYERLGFSVLSAGVELLPGGPRHWRMRRAAQVGADA